MLRTVRDRALLVFTAKRKMGLTPEPGERGWGGVGGALRSQLKNPGGWVLRGHCLIYYNVAGYHMESILTPTL